MKCCVVNNFRGKCVFRSVSSRTWSWLSSTAHNCSPSGQGQLEAL